MGLISFIILPFASKYITKIISNKIIDSSIDVNMINLFIPGIILIIIGLILVMLYMIYKKIKNKELTK